MKLEGTTESGLGFIDDALGFNYCCSFVIVYETVQLKIKVFANIGYDISFKSITLESTMS